MADADYDVWLMNNRGTLYSRNHISKNPDNSSSGFWNFSWYDIGVQDSPAVIDYILEKTNREKLFFIGYSQGVTSLLVLLSERPEYNDKISVATLMAPVGYLKSFQYLKIYLNFLLPFVQVI